MPWSEVEEMFLSVLAWYWWTVRSYLTPSTVIRRRGLITAQNMLTKDPCLEGGGRK